MPSLDTLPYELLLEIHKHNLPPNITSITQFYAFVQSKKVNVNIYRAAIEAFWTYAIFNINISSDDFQNATAHQGRPVPMTYKGLDKINFLRNLHSVEIVLCIVGVTIHRCATQDFIDAVKSRLAEMQYVRSVKIVVECMPRSAKEGLRELLNDALTATETRLGRSIQKEVAVVGFPRPVRLPGWCSVGYGVWNGINGR